MAVLQLATPAQVIQQERQAANDQVLAQDKAKSSEAYAASLAAFIDNQFSMMARHRDGSSGWSDRLQTAMRIFNGQYDTAKLMAIRQFGGSEVYARIVATKCRGATSLLRDVYLNQEKPWGLKPTPDPTLPENVLQDVMTLVQVEVQTMARMGQQVPPAMIRDRVLGLMTAAKNAALKKAGEEAKKAFLKLDDILVEGGFYEALAAFLVDLPLFPFACMKGPVVRIVPKTTWQNGVAITMDKPQMFWNRVSPFDIWWTPGVSNIADAAVIERSRLVRADLNQLLGLPGYNDAAIREVLQWYGQSGYVEAWASSTDTPRAIAESREDPRMNESGMIDMLEYHGYVQGRLLLDQGMSSSQIPDPLKDYFVDAYKIGRYIIKVQLSPSLRKRPYYYVTSFEKVPGTAVGNALPDILADIGDVANSALRSLVNNMSIASGPQVVVNDDVLADNETGEEMYPWKRWHVVRDPLGSQVAKPIEFFQPTSNAQELLGVYEKFTQIADEISSIPRYITGSERLGGAGRTASGLAMLMGNAAKILQTVAANIDRDVVKPSVEELYDLIMLTDRTGTLRGDEAIEVLGVNVAMQRETQRQRQLEFLATTMNPVDVQIMGVRGRANVLRSVSDSIGMAGVEVVPPDEEIKARMAGSPGAALGVPGSPGAAPSSPAGGPPGPPQELQPPQTNVVSSMPGAAPGASPSPAQGPA